MTTVNPGRKRRRLAGRLRGLWRDFTGTTELLANQKGIEASLQRLLDRGAKLENLQELAEAGLQRLRESAAKLAKLQELADAGLQHLEDGRAKLERLQEVAEAGLRRLEDIVQDGLHRLEGSAAKQQTVQELEARLDRMWLHIDFIRTHSAAYLGEGVALTHLVDEMPMLVNSNDFGGPLNFISGGRYEEENLDVLLSFLNGQTVFLDVGANLGFFSLQLGDRLRRQGRVFAFEPHPRLVELARQNAMLNGLNGVITVHDFGLSDVAAEVDFSFPKGHLGGGFIGHDGDTEHFDVVHSRVQRLDDVFPPDFTADLMKIDVEGHELAALRGMRALIARSPSLKILFEKLGRHAGYEAGIEALFEELGYTLYAVVGDARLEPIAAGGLAPFSGYALAARAVQIDDLNRRRFNIFPSQLSVPGAVPPGPGEPLARTAAGGQVLFHGPYWYLRRGVWDLYIHGSMEGEIDITVAERFGYATQTLRVAGGQRVWRFVNQRDLVRFELVARAVGSEAHMMLERLELVRIA